MSESTPIGAPSVGIVIPIHNEGDFLLGAIDLIAAQLSSVPASLSLHLVENGSTDDTAAVVDAISAEHDWIFAHHLAEANYGGAMRVGFTRATDAGAEWVVNFDIDYFSGAFIQDLIGSVQRADIVIASKRAPGSDDRRSILRRVATFVFNLILRAALGSGVSDTHGIKAFRREVIDKLADAVEHNEDLFDTELVLRAERTGYVIREVPIVVEELRETRSSLLRRVPRTLWGIATLRRSLARENA
ncbi:MAG: glycosyltransferase [Acidimicrobiia bacterium]|nr:glycosyltransferase [Acidimicrobiia bacterium]